MPRFVQEPYAQAIHLCMACLRYHLFRSAAFCAILLFTDGDEPFVPLSLRIPISSPLFGMLF